MTPGAPLLDTHNAGVRIAGGRTPSGAVGEVVESGAVIVVFEAPAAGAVAGGGGVIALCVLGRK